MAILKGNCYVCGKKLAKTAMKNHMLKDHQAGESPFILIRAEGSYNKNFWLLFAVPFEASLNRVDTFLRKIWCECCGHLSAFSQTSYGRYSKIPKTTKVADFYPGAVIDYEYDMGSTTKITLTCLDALKLPEPTKKIYLLARNIAPEVPCSKCGDMATMYDYEGDELLCDSCSEPLEDEVLPFVNSPRWGVCGYNGYSDQWTFSPDGPFPQY
ncbi:MAG: hypothetical protein Q4G11_06800 [Gallicola sp.]|nr:hypothetical protein [Gallicola sp.]